MRIHVLDSLWHRSPLLPTPCVYFLHADTCVPDPIDASLDEFHRFVSAPCVGRILSFSSPVVGFELRGRGMCPSRFPFRLFPPLLTCVTSSSTSLVFVCCGAISGSGRDLFPCDVGEFAFPCFVFLDREEPRRPLVVGEHGGGPRRLSQPLSARALFCVRAGRSFGFMVRPRRGAGDEHRGDPH